MRTFGRVPNPFPPSGKESSNQLYDWQFETVTLDNGELVTTDTGEVVTLSPQPPYIWVEVETAPNGDNSYVYLTALIQTLRLNLNESPFWGNFGIPAHQTILTQTQPDYYVNFITTYYSKYFASLIVTKQAQTPNNTTPIYNIAAIFLNGATVSLEVAI